MREPVSKRALRQWSRGMLAAILYSATTLFANPPATAAAGASPAAAGDIEAVAALREGAMKKLVLHSAPRPVPDTTFETIDGRPASLADYRGRWLLVNFWATWCAPCRKEMPSLASLQRELGGPDFAVVTIATGRNPPAAVKAFFAEIGVDNLPMLRDPDMALARALGVLGLPLSLIVDPEGREVARLIGEADWASPSARAVITALKDGGA